MKLNKFLIFVFSLFILNSCVQDSFESEMSDLEEDTGDYYLCLNLAMADDVSTRGDGESMWNEDSNGRFDYDYENVNLQYEKYIKKGRVYIFSADKGKTEDEAMMITSGRFGDIGTTVGGNSFATDVLKINNIRLDNFDFDETDNTTYYVLIVANPEETQTDDLFNAPKKGDNFKTWATTLQKCSMTMLDGEQTGIFNNTVSGPNTDYIFNRYLTMTNATGQINHNLTEPFNPTTLVPLNKKYITRKFMSDEELAELEITEERTKVYLQRNVAKVTVKPHPNLNGEKKMITVGDWKVQTSIANFYIDVYNNETYPVMKIKDGSNFLSWDKTYGHSGGYNTGEIEKFDRVFWCYDHNYHSSTPLAASSFKRAPDGGMWGSAHRPMYCLENTFDYDCMLQGQTTRVIVRCKWQWHEPEVGNRFPDDCVFKGDDEYEAFYRVGDYDVIWCRYHINEALTSKAAEILSTEENPLTKENFKVVWDNNVKTGGYYSLTDLLKIVHLNSGNEVGDEIIGADLDMIASALSLKDATNDKISLYINCHMYFVVRLPHFLEVKWDKGTEVKRKSENDFKFIADYKEKHLGRYGVVRNNYYEVWIDEIHNMGSPGIPDIIDDDTDDMPDDYFLGATVKVLSWARHDISVGF